MRASYNNSRRASVKHSGREFSTESAHIDSEKTAQNLVWTHEQHEFMPMDQAPALSQLEYEYYSKHFGPALEAQNERHKKSRHYEKIKKLDEWLDSPRYAPEESILQLGTMEDHPDAQLLAKVAQDYAEQLDTWSKERGQPFAILDMALHVDEATPHIHMRRVWRYVDEESGLEMIGQKKALQLAGVNRPDPSKANSRHNSEKMTFDKMARELFQQVAHKHGIELETTPRSEQAEHLTPKEYRAQAKAKEKARKAEEAAKKAMQDADKAKQEALQQKQKAEEIQRQYEVERAHMRRQSKQLKDEREKLKEEQRGFEEMKALELALLHEQNAKGAAQLEDVTAQIQAARKKLQKLAPMLYRAGIVDDQEFETVMDRKPVRSEQIKRKEAIQAIQQQAAAPNSVNSGSGSIPRSQRPCTVKGF